MECIQALVELYDVRFCHLFGGSCGDNPEWKGHHFLLLELSQN